jgi:hypothetical protein
VAHAAITPTWQGKTPPREPVNWRATPAAFILSFAVAHGCDLGFRVADNDLDVAVAALWGSD